MGILARDRSTGLGRSDQVALLPTQRSPAAAVPRSSLRTATVLLVDPDRATREPLKASLVEVGIGRVVEAPSVAAVEEILQRQIVGDLALVSLQLGADTVAWCTCCASPAGRAPSPWPRPPTSGR
jgi:hypothetical protein